MLASTIAGAKPDAKEDYIQQAQIAQVYQKNHIHGLLTAGGKSHPLLYRFNRHLPNLGDLVHHSSLPTSPLDSTPLLINLTSTFWGTSAICRQSEYLFLTCFHVVCHHAQASEYQFHHLRRRRS